MIENWRNHDVKPPSYDVAAATSPGTIGASANAKITLSVFGLNSLSAIARAFPNNFAV